MGEIMAQDIVANDIIKVPAERIEFAKCRSNVVPRHKPRRIYIPCDRSESKDLRLVGIDFEIDRHRSIQNIQTTDVRDLVHCRDADSIASSPQR